MRLGIWHVVVPESGGAYQYAEFFCRALHDSADELEDEVVVFAPDPGDRAHGWLQHPRWSLAPTGPPSHAAERPWSTRLVDGVLGQGRARQLYQRLYHARVAPRLRPRVHPTVVLRRPEQAAWFDRFGVELMLYLAPTRVSFEAGVPYVMAIHDVQHRLQPEFPEVSADGEFETREYVFRNGAANATMILADSEEGREDLLRFYGEHGLTPDRVKVLPHLPASYVPRQVDDDEIARVRRAYGLPERFLFYPAQFWPHKNHARIVEALAKLRADLDLEIPLVLAGSHSGKIREQEHDRVRGLVERLGLRRQVLFLGYVPDADMAGLYGGAVALVMPTFFGNTNLPILEAWRLGCPVLYSDIRGLRDQAGDAAVLVDPGSVDAIADGIRRLWTDEALRRDLTARGHERLARYTPEDFRRRLVGFVKEAKERRK
jgi:glycosyltransferase involved in cell wall biosynthesis